MDSGSGRARLHANHVPVSDFGNFFNAVTPGGASVPSHVSFDVRWAGHGGRHKIRDATFGFRGHYVTSATTISFKAANDHGDVIYRSDRAGQYNPPVEQGGAGPPAVGHERNGVFFR